MQHYKSRERSNVERPDIPPIGSVTPLRYIPGSCERTFQSDFAARCLCNQWVNIKLCHFGMIHHYRRHALCIASMMAVISCFGAMRKGFVQDTSLTLRARVVDKPKTDVYHEAVVLFYKGV